MTPNQHAAIDCFNPDDLIMSATAYYLCRSTMMVSSHCDALVEAWEFLLPTTQDWIRRLVDSQFEREERLRQSNASSLLLQMECDRQAWNRVRSLWTDEEANVTDPQGSPPGKPVQRRTRRQHPSLSGSLQVYVRKRYATKSRA